MSERITIEKKLGLFELVLSREIKEERLKQREIEADVNRKESVEKQEQIKKSLEKIDQKYTRLTERNIPKLINASKTKAKNLILMKEKEIENGFFEELKTAFLSEEFSEYYKIYLENSIALLKQIIPEEKLIIYIREKDRALFTQLAERIIPDFEISFKNLSPVSIAGFIARDKSEHISYDFSIENLIEENKEYIASAFAEAMSESEE